MDKKLKYITAPDKCSSYLTPHKSYEVLLSDKYGWNSIEDDNGDVINIKLKSCTHLYGGDWLEPVNNEPQLSITREQAALDILCSIITNSYDGDIDLAIELADELIAKLNEQP